MKKTNIFSRILAVIIAAATAVVPLSSVAIATGGKSTPKYSVKIISPDVPTGGTYTYNFYQIIKGDVEADENGKHVIANPEWGNAFGSNFTTEKITISHIDGLPDGEDGDYKLSRDQILITSFDGNVQENKGNYGGGTGKNAWLDAISGLYNNFVSINQSYGLELVRLNTESTFIYSGGSASLPRTSAGFVELLNKYVTSSSMLKAFTDLLFNGIPAGTVSDAQEEIKFLDSNYTPTNIAIGGQQELTVTLDEPGYYLIACVDENSKLTNEGYKKPKPISAMLLLVGPNEEANTIVGKNTTAVATVDLTMFHETIPLDHLSPDDGYVSGSVEYKLQLPDNAKALGYFEDPSADPNDENAKWVDRAAFGNLQKHIAPNESGPTFLQYYDEYVLCRIDITLPENFTSYKDVGYFLAVAGDWNNSRTVNGTIIRERCRPLIYVKHADENTATRVGVLDVNTDSTTDESKGHVINCGSTYNTNANNPLYGKTWVKDNIGKDPSEYFYLGNLFNDNLYANGTFKGGDHIYIYFPAFYTPETVCGGAINGNSMILDCTAHTIYSNNPHAPKMENTSTTVDSVTRYVINEHINSGDVGISTGSSININNYSLKVSVTGIKSDRSVAYNTNTSYFALYKQEDGKKKYALMINAQSPSNTIVYGWYAKDEVIALKSSYSDYFDDVGNLKPSLTSASISSSSTNPDNMIFKLPSQELEIMEFYNIIYGLAPGEYYIEELTIGNDDSNNIKINHYQKATQPFKLTIGQKYNVNYAPFNKATQGQLIDELSVGFDQVDPKDRTIDSEIVKPAPGDDKHNVVKTRTETEAANADGIVEVKITHNSLNLIWLPETGGIGTTIFFIVGGAIVVAATVLIVTRFRVKRERL